LLGSEEIKMFSTPMKFFNDSLKKKLLLSNESLNILFETEIKSKKSETNFWKEFLSNQKKNNTEIFGGFKPILFTNEDERIIKSEKNKNNKTGGNKKRFEKIELHKNYIHKYFGTCSNIIEFDYKDKEIKRNLEETEFNKKETSSFIENINNYSLRKLEKLNYISAFNNEQKFTKNNNDKKIDENNVKNIESKIINTRKEPELFTENIELKKSNLLREMKLKYQENSEKIKKESADRFRKVLFKLLKSRSDK